MKAFAIVWGPNNGGVTLALNNGIHCLAIFNSYTDAVKTLAGLDDADDRKIIEVKVTT